MKIILTGFLCLFFASALCAQTAETSAQSIEKISLAREKKDRSIEENVEIFAPTDVPVYCYVGLTAALPTTVRAVFIAVKAEGLHPGAKIASVEYRTKSGENGVSFRAKPPGKSWAAGDYRVEIFLNGNIEGSQTFKVEN